VSANTNTSKSSFQCDASATLEVRMGDMDMVRLREGVSVSVSVKYGLEHRVHLARKLHSSSLPLPPPPPRVVGELAWCKVMWREFDVRGPLGVRYMEMDPVLNSDVPLNAEQCCAPARCKRLLEYILLTKVSSPTQIVGLPTTVLSSSSTFSGVTCPFPSFALLLLLLRRPQLILLPTPSSLTLTL
jgi:hypothetical protein